LIGAVENRNFTVFFYVVVTRRPVLHFLLDKLVQRTVTGHSAHRIAPEKTAPVKITLGQTGAKKRPKNKSGPSRVARV